MKKFFAVSLAIGSSLLLLTGCNETQAPIVPNIPTTSTPNIPYTSEPQVNKPKSNPRFISSTLISSSAVDHFGNVNDPATKDCIGMFMGNVEDSDLLTTMIGDDDSRAMMNLDVYTKEYLQNLQKKVETKAKNDLHSDIYSFDVCHLGKNVDVVLATLWPEGQSAKIQDGKFEGELADHFGENKAMIIVNGDTVNVNTEVPVLPMPAMFGGGDGVYPCKGELKDDKIQWECFLGNNKNPKRNITTSSTDFWTISLDGKIEKTWEEN